jgi:hypothetical protein
VSGTHSCSRGFGCPDSQGGFEAFEFGVSTFDCLSTANGSECSFASYDLAFDQFSQSYHFIVSF